MTTKPTTLWEVDGWHEPDGPGLMGYCTISVPGHHQGIRVYGDRLVAEYRATLIVRVVNAHATLVAALREIAVGAGPYSRNRLTHAESTIEAMKEQARAALELVEGKE